MLERLQFFPPSIQSFDSHFRVLIPHKKLSFWKLKLGEIKFWGMKFVILVSYCGWNKTISNKNEEIIKATLDMYFDLESCAERCMQKKLFHRRSQLVKQVTSFLVLYLSFLRTVTGQNGQLVLLLMQKFLVCARRWNCCLACDECNRKILLSFRDILFEGVTYQDCY